MLDLLFDMWLSGLVPCVEAHPQQDINKSDVYRLASKLFFVSLLMTWRC